MGTHYYLVIPKLKIIIWIGKNISEECLDEDEKNMKDLFNLWFDYHYEDNLPELIEIKEKTLRNFKVQDLMSITFYISKIENFLDLQNNPKTVLRYITAKSIDKNFYIISDNSEKMDKLKKKEYKIVEEDEL